MRSRIGNPSESLSLDSNGSIDRGTSDLAPKYFLRDRLSRSRCRIEFNLRRSQSDEHRFDGTFNTFF